MAGANLVKMPKKKVVTQIVTTIERIDRDRAVEYLQKRAPHQRPIRISHIESLAGDMTRGEWDFTGEPIIFDDNGQLIDGQHRLEAVLLSGVSLDFVVTRGVAAKSYRNIDRGVTRSVADNNPQPYSREQGAWLNAARRIIACVTTRLTSSMLNRYQDECTAAICFGIDQFQTRTPFNKSAVLGMFVLAHPTNPAKVEEFYAMLRSDNVSTGDKPLFTLRLYLQGRYREDSVRDQGMKILRCIKAHIEGEKIAASRLYAVEATTDFFGKKYPADSIVRQR